MKVAFLFMHPFSESMGSVIRVKELAQGIGGAGAEAYIITPYERTYDLSPKVHVLSANNLTSNPGFSKALYKLTKMVYYSRFFPDLFATSDAQTSGLISFLVKQIVKLLEKNGIDIIQVEQDAPLPLGVALKKETNLPLVADLHNISSEELAAMGLLQKSSGNFMSIQKETAHLLRQTNHVAVVSNEMLDYVAQNYGVPRCNMTVVPPGGRVSTKQSQETQPDKSLKVTYAGLVAYRERVDIFVNSMPFAKRHNDNLNFYVTNKGEALKSIKKLAKKLQVNPYYFWYNSYEMVDKFLSTCQVGILPSSNDTARRMGIPLKLFNYLSAGLPVVANDVGGWSKLIEDEEVGILASDNPRDFADAVTSLVGDPQARKIYSQNGMELIKKEYNWAASANKLLNIYGSLLD